LKGEIAGVGAFGKSIVVGARDMLDLSISVQTQVAAYGYTYCFGTYAERQWMNQVGKTVLGGAGKGAMALTEAGVAFQQQKKEEILAILAGDWKPVNKHSASLKWALSKGAEAIEKTYLAYMSAGEGEQGKMTGRALMEVASLASIFAKSGQLANVSKAEYLTALKQRPFFQSETLAPRMAELDPFVADLCRGVSCFVAGTPVLTPQGEVAIEKIRPGMAVLTRPELAGTQSVGTVSAVFVTHPKTLYHITFQIEFPGVRQEVWPIEGVESLEEELVSSSTHPYFVVETNGFVPAKALAVGRHLWLNNGGVAEVTQIAKEEAALGRAFTTYNFEVLDYHTYFVAKSGVWVHNTGTPCGAAKEVADEAKSIILPWTKENPAKAWLGHQEACEKLFAQIGENQEKLRAMQEVGWECFQKAGKPNGFASAAQFQQALTELLAAARNSGLSDAQVGIRGSSLTGVGFKKGVRDILELRTVPNDFDFFIESEIMFSKVSAASLLEGQIEGRILMQKYPEMRRWATTWCKALNRSLIEGPKPWGWKPQSAGVHHEKLLADPYKYFKQ
jgi:hypothetical protein